MRKYFFTLAILFLITGCGTIMDFSTSEDSSYSSKPPHIYGGVRIDAIGIKHGLCRGPGFERLLFLIDLPLSFVLDTAILPISIPVHFTTAKQDPYRDLKKE